MLHNEARELLVKGYAKRGNAKEIAEAYSVSLATVYRLARQKKETGTVALRVSQRGRKRKLGEEDLRRIDEAIAMQADITIHELTEKLQLPASEETVRRTVVEMGYRLKKKMIHASEQERPRCPGEAEAMGRERHKN